MSALLRMVLWLTPPPSEAAVVPAGAFMMSPYQVPSTFMKTSRLLLATTSLPVRLKTVRFVLADPEVALPAEVLSLTVALPVLATACIALLMDWFVLFVVVEDVFISALLMVYRGTLLASRVSTKFGGNKMSPFRLPLIFITPKKDCPAVTAEFNMFTIFATAFALPLVALPAEVL